MSISAMTRLLQARQAEDSIGASVLESERGTDSAGPSREGSKSAEAAKQSAAAAKQSAAAKESAEAAKATALEKLAAFVPTEVVTAWGAAVGLLVPKADWQRWAIFGGALVVMIVLIHLNAALLRKQARPSTEITVRPRVKPGTLRLIIISTVAFTIWCFAAPGSPAVMWGDGATRLFAVLALFVTPVLYKLAQLWGLAPLN